MFGEEIAGDLRACIDTDDGMQRWWAVPRINRQSYLAKTAE
jgi:hypothetical protein